MSGLCGYFGLSIEQGHETVLDSMRDNLSPAMAENQTQIWRSGHGAAVACCTRRTPLDAHQQDSCLTVIFGLASLAGSREQLACRMATLWHNEGAAACAALSGSFLLCILDEARQQCLLAIDRAGVQSLHFQQAGNGLLFGSNAQAVCAHPLGSRTLAPQAILDYLYFHVIPSPRTVFQQQSRLAPGTYLHWNKGSCRIGNYWRMQYDTAAPLQFGERRDQFRQCLRAAVDEVATGTDCGTFLSGGTDSSTLTGMLATSQATPARSYSIGFDVAGYDELPYARLAARHFGSHHHELYVAAQDVLDAIPRIAAAADQPFGNASVVPAFHCASMAYADGMRTLLAGDGGDELFGGNARYAQQALLSHYDAVPAFLRQMVLEPVLFGLAADWQFGSLHKARRYIEQATMPMPLRLESYNLLMHYGAETVLEADFHAAVDVADPAMQLHASYWSGKGRNQMERMQSLDMRYTLAENDLRKVILACELAGVDVAFPFLNDAMLAFSASLPAQEKLRGTRLRYFFKRALADFLPPAILSKQKHGFGLPFGPWLQQHQGLRTCALDTLSDLKRRRIVRSAFIDRLTGELVGQHPSYHGTMVWILLMLEQWLARSKYTATYQF